MKRGTRLMSEAQISEAVRLYEDGWSLRQLAPRFHVGYATVDRALRAAGVKMRPPGNPTFGVPVWVDPIWGRLGYLMYSQREAFPANVNSGESRSTARIDLGSPPK